MAEIKEFLGTGRRKTAVASVSFWPPAPGKIVAQWFSVFPKELDFPTDTLRTLAVMALAATESADHNFDIRINVQGGGPIGQAGAVRHGIARALLLVDAALRPTLKAAGLLTRDPRMRERENTASRARANASSTASGEPMKAAIVGASGYSGEELVRLLLRHPQVELAAVTSRQHAGQTVAQVFPDSPTSRAPKICASASRGRSCWPKRPRWYFWRCRTAWRRNSPLPSRSGLPGH